MKQPRRRRNWQSSLCGISRVLLLRSRLIARLLIRNDICHGRVIPSWHTRLVSVLRMNASCLCLQSVVWMARHTPAHVRLTLQELLWIIRADVRQWALEMVSQQFGVYSKSEAPICVILIVYSAHDKFPRIFFGSCSLLWTKAKNEL